jgi:YVTN family beta-propeller protein
MLLVTAMVACGLPAAGQGTGRVQPGPLENGLFLLPTGWAIYPAGRHAPLPGFPLASAASRDGRHLLILSRAASGGALSLVDVAGEREVQRILLPGAGFGLALNAKGDRVYAAGGFAAAIYEFALTDGKLTAGRRFLLVPRAKRTDRHFAGDVALSPDGRFLYVASLFEDRILVLNAATGLAVSSIRTGRRPFRILPHADGKSLFVTSWADGRLFHYAVEEGAELASLRLGPQPMDMVWRSGKPEHTEEEVDWTARLFVAGSGSNVLYTVGVTEAKDMRLLETVNLALTPQQPAGMMPTALSLSPDRSRLYAACSGANSIAVVEVAGLRAVPLGFLPSGWWPSGVRQLPEGKVAILTGKGDGSPRPAPEAGYAGATWPGTVAFLDSPDLPRLDALTDTVFRVTPYSDRRLVDAGVPEGNPIPARPGDPTPIEHVVYILKAGLGFDQVLGSPASGDGTARFKAEVTANHRKLASEFVLLDNFQVVGDGPLDGAFWAAAAIAPPFLELAASRGEGAAWLEEAVAQPPAGFLWTSAALKGLAFRNYGWWVRNLEEPENGRQVAKVLDPVLEKATSLEYRGPDPAYSDVERARVVLADLERWETMPRLTLIRLSGDERGAEGSLPPPSRVAEHDQALGMLVEGLSKSRFWPKMAIFIAESVAGPGASVPGARRGIGLIASPYARRGATDGTMYTTTSMVRTIELLLGLFPMTHFDAAALPMANAFGSEADTTPFEAVRR